MALRHGPASLLSRAFEERSDPGFCLGRNARGQNNEHPVKEHAKLVTP